MMKTKIALRVGAAALLLVLLFSLCGCGHVGSEEEVLGAARDLLVEGMTLNAWYFEKDGIPADPAGSTGKYAPADEAWTVSTGIRTTDDLRQKNAAVFSAALCERLEQLVFANERTEGGTVLHYTRYYDRADGDGAVLMVDTEPDPLVLGRDTLSLASLAVKELGRGYAVVTVDISVTYEGDTQKAAAVPIRLVYENGVWLLDTFLYLTYDVGRSE